MPYSKEQVFSQGCPLFKGAMVADKNSATDNCSFDAPDNFDASALRALLNDTITRGRSSNFTLIPSDGSFVESPFFESYSEKNTDVNWERVCLKICDDRDKSQCTITLRIARLKRSPPRNTYNTYPAVCILHGTGKSFDTANVLDFALTFVRRGFLVILFNSRYHGCRKEKNSEGKRHYLDALVEAWKQNSRTVVERNLYPFIYDTAADLSIVADYLLSRSDVKKGMLGITGISLGGMHSWFAAAADSRWTAVAPLIGVQSFKYAVDELCYDARVKTIDDVFQQAAKDMGESAITPKVVCAVWDCICPGLLQHFDGGKSLALLCPRPVFIGNGELDPRCPPDGVTSSVNFARSVYQEQGADSSKIELKFYEGIGHEVTDEMITDCVNFFGRVFRCENP